METPRLGLISDTHGDLRGWQRARKYWGRVEGILHGGDVLYHGPRNALPREYGPKALAEAMNRETVPLLVARGNCDAEVDQCMFRFPILSSLVTLWWRGKRILVCHGEDFTSFRRLALDWGAHLAVSGHTHVGSVQREEGTIFVNPGSSSLPRGRDPESAGIIDEKGITLFTLEKQEILHREPW